jgi:ubiquinone/menaquinone biosynthesis C-methylase UbiE
MNDLERLEAYFDRVAVGFDSIYSGDKPRIFRLWDRLTRRSLKERLEFSLSALSPLAGCRVLDVGCGSGRGSVALAEHGAKEVVGIDVSSRMLELADDLAASRGVADRCRFERADVLSYHGGAFDHAVATGFWDYVREPLPVMEALARLVSGGVVASFPARISPRVPFRALWLRARRCPVRFYSSSQIAALCEQSGFEVKELRRSGPMFLLHARRRRN